MARTTGEVLDALRSIVPPAYHGDDEASVLGSVAKVFSLVETTIDALYDAGLWGGATGEWLDLHALGWDVRRSDGESDGSLRSRLRDYPEQVVPAAIIAAVDPLINDVDPLADDARLMEHWKDGAFFDQAYCDQENARIGSVNVAFSVIVPDVFGDPTDDRYAAMVWAVEAIRPHGARWFLVIDNEPPAAP